MIIPYETLVDLTDAGNARLLINVAGGDLRYVHETKQWMHWTGSRWEIDDHEVFVTKYALEVARIYMESANEQKERGNVAVSMDRAKWSKKCRNKTAIDAMIALARKTEGVPISVTELDKDPWLLGVANGVVDLKTGTLREAESREDFITKRCTVRFVPGAPCPRWQSLIEQATGLPLPVKYDAAGSSVPESVGQYTPRPDLAFYLRVALGYSITGVVKSQVFFMAIGGGSNGKSLILDTVKGILGPYAITVPSALFLLAKNGFGDDAERPTSVAATLAGARLAVASETREGQKLNAAAIKSHTGDAQMTARKMRENVFTFDVSHKVWFLTNAQPELDHMDAAIRGRLNMVPFDRQWNRPGEVDRDPTLPDGDENLSATLKDEQEGILAWLIQSATMYHLIGIKPPEAVAARTREYVEDQDTLGRWIATAQRCEPRVGTRSSKLFEDYKMWCHHVDGSFPTFKTQKAFSQALAKRKVPAWVGRDGNYWGLIPTPPPLGIGQGPLPPQVIAPRVPLPPPGQL